MFDDIRENDKPARRLRILVTEDDVVSQKLAMMILKKMGHEVVIAENGKVAVAQLQKSRFDLVLMDIHMPEMDGYAATEAIRRWESLRGSHTPIIAVTANTMTADRNRCLKKGMDGYLAKPITTEAVARAIQFAFAMIAEHG